MKVLASAFMIALLFSTLVVTVHFGTVRAATTWTQTYGGVAAEEGNSLVETSDGGYAIVGSTESFGAGETDVWLVKTDAFGTVEWNITHGGSDYDFGRSLVVTSDGGYAIAGYTSSYGAGVADFWLVKTDEFGVVPEATWVILPLLLVATVSIFICNKKLHQFSKEK